MEAQKFTVKYVYGKSVLHTSIPEDRLMSAVVTWTRNKTGRHDRVVWPVYSPFVPKEEQKHIKISQAYELPTLVTFTLFIETEGKGKHTHRTYHIDAVPGLNFSKTVHGLGWMITPETVIWLQDEMANDPAIAKLMK
jgi:hypothetical protein